MGEEDIAKFHDNSYTYKELQEMTTLEIPVYVKGFNSIHGITTTGVQMFQKSLKDAR